MAKKPAKLPSIPREAALAYARSMTPEAREAMAKFAETDAERLEKPLRDELLVLAKACRAVTRGQPDVSENALRVLQEAVGERPKTKPPAK